MSYLQIHTTKNIVVISYLLLLRYLLISSVELPSSCIGAYLKKSTKV